MGLFSFIKDAGAKVFGIGKTTAEEKAEAAADKAAIEAAENKRAVAQMENMINNLGFKVENLCISIDGDVATLSGTAANQETREKVILVVGNSAGIAGVEDNMDVKIEEPVATFHTVERGDTLSKIAKKVYGNAMKYPVIFEANKPMLTHPDKIYPGQVLRIPALD
ncbi:peptidoglycan-binding protein LysM [Ulvibacter antarcticus]|uniref:Potassium binding protein Kbp n=1 Tax=Ulvibacter antarcticus TaxID=442714 RepID=A0A3L9YD33_9FLAO|nr:peptidoglycan-binding protein LysM [Ulvibacter antarcticus]RMA58606.1 nucleoid-associated protein YgaU [Ulvibacter antarcticus]